MEDISQNFGLFIFDTLSDFLGDIVIIKKLKVKTLRSNMIKNFGLHFNQESSKLFRQVKCNMHRQLSRGR